MLERIERGLRRLSLAGKLNVLSMTTSGVSMTAVCAVLGWYDVTNLRQYVANDAIRLVEMVGASSTATIVFNDPKSAEETLRTVGVNAQIVTAAILRADGSTLSRYDRPHDGGVGPRPLQREWAMANDAPWHAFGESTLVTASPIVFNGDLLGTAYLEIDLAELDTRTRRLWQSLALALFGTVALAGFTSSQLQRVVSDPLLRLTAITRVVTRDRNYAIRAPHTTDDEIGELVHGFNEMLDDIQRRDTTLQQHRLELERTVEDRTAELKSNMERFKVLVESTQAVPWEAEATSTVLSYISPQAKSLLGYDSQALAGKARLLELVHPDDRERVRSALLQLATSSDRQDLDIDYRLLAADGGALDVHSVVSAHRLDDDAIVLRGISIDVTRQKKLEMELRQAQKLESVGRLAAGVAHEINTPVQFVSDSLHFVRDATADLSALIAEYRRLEQAVVSGSDTTAHAVRVREVAEAADLEYLTENVPKALDRALEGLGRVADIVRSMKEFAHPDRKEMTSVDLNRAIQSTLVIARNEYKYVADVETEFGDLPLVNCHLGDINQVVLNIVVNAAHAIADVVSRTGTKGTIAVRTRRDGDHVVVEIEDTGTGIPEELHERIFDPFFTTKAVGHGTGQGLAIARSVVRDKHGGTLTFRSAVGQGATFSIRLPIAGGKREESAA